VLANSRTRPVSARRALVAVAVPTTMAALLCTATLAGTAFASGSSAAATGSTPCSTSTGHSGAGTPSTRPSTGSTTASAGATTPGVTPSPSADSTGAHAPSDPIATASTTAAPPAPTAKPTQTASPGASPTATPSGGGFWGWLNGVWQWIFDGTQQLTDALPQVAAAAPLQGVPIGDSASGHSGSTKSSGTKSGTVTSGKSSTKPAKAGSPTECATTAAPLKKDPAAAAGVSGAIIPWHLSTPSMTMYGLTFNGVTSLDTANGPEQVLDFTVDKVEIESMVTYSYPGGPDGQRQYNNAGSGTTTVLTNGHLWTTSMTANVYGLIQVTLTPTSTPTELLSIAQGFTIPIPVVFTDVNADNAMMSTGTLDIPGFDGYAGS
jgi:hypothetical protein